jgi:L-lactate dehydrogenase complex protein LldG
MSREQILSRIRSGLQQSRSFLDAEAAKAPHTPPPFVHPPATDLADQFVEELEKLAGKVHRCADDEEALETIAIILEVAAARTVLSWDFERIGLPGLEALLKKQAIIREDAAVRAERRKDQFQILEPVPVCISGADYAIAESGTLLLRHGPGKPRIASLLAPSHIAVLRRAQILRGLGEALVTLREQHGDGIFDPTSNLTLITGPSRTADIEMTLTLGIHGPREIHVVLIG